MKGYSIFVLSIVLLVAVFVSPAKSRPVQKTSFDNIKVLTDMSDADIRKEMMNWTEALGVQCSYCHVSGDFASDMNPKKETARKMATMVKAINKDFLAGKAQCVLCHRGTAVPDPSL